jgi:hypothetical protein
MAAAVADLLDLSLAGELVGHQVESAGRPRSAELPAELGVPTDYLEHARLAARDADGERVELRWRVIGDVAHVSRVAEPADLARALAWRAGRWGERWIVEALLRDPKRAAELLAESDLDDA